MGNVLPIRAQGRGPEEDKGVHAPFKEGLHGAKETNPGVCINSTRACV